MHLQLCPWAEKALEPPPPFSLSRLSLFLSLSFYLAHPFHYIRLARVGFSACAIISESPSELLEFIRTQSGFAWHPVLVLTPVRALNSSEEIPTRLSAAPASVYCANHCC